MTTAVDRPRPHLGQTLQLIGQLSFARDMTYPYQGATFVWPETNSVAPRKMVGHLLPRDTFLASVLPVIKRLIDRDRRNCNIPLCYLRSVCVPSNTFTSCLRYPCIRRPCCAKADVLHHNRINAKQA